MAHQSHTLSNLAPAWDQFVLSIGSACWKGGCSGFISFQSLSHVLLFATPWTAACQAPLSITNSRSLLKRMSIELVMSSNYPSLCHPLLLLPSVFPGIRVFSNESVLCIRWLKYCSFSLSISLSNEHPSKIPDSKKKNRYSS